MIARMLDNIVCAFAPAAGARRLAARQMVAQLSRRGLDAGKTNRLTSPRRAGAEAGDPRALAEIQNARADSWDSFQNNPTMRKAVRVVVAQTVGCGLMPESMATTPAGEPFDDFRAATKELWQQWGAACDFLGLPGRGGQDVGGLQCQALKGVVAAGEILTRFRRLSNDAAAKLGLPIPLQLEMLEAERLAETDTLIRPRQRSGNTRIFRGIEYDQDGHRVAYHFYKAHPQDPKWWSQGLTFETDPVPVDEIVHLFLADRPSQTRGLPWAAPSLRTIRDLGDTHENELVAAAAGACPTFITKTVDGSPIPGLNAPAGASNTDRDGNRVTRMQAATAIALMQGEDVAGFTPGRPNPSIEPFAQHLIRIASGGLPGVKASSIHQDYRGSSYSSEKSADNDCWRETEQVQEWFVVSWLRPVWAAVIEAGVMSGWFAEKLDGRTFSVAIYRANRAAFDAVSWGVPVAKSINPLQDENAISQGLKNGTNSVPDAAASMGYRWRELIDKQAEVYRYAKSKGLPEGVVAQLLGLTTSPAMPDIGPDPSAVPDQSGEPGGAAVAKPGPKGVAA